MDSHPCRNRIHITGTVDRQEVPAYLEHVDIYVLPSLQDGCPNSLLEAMYAKKAIVASDVSGIREAIDHEHSGLLVAPGSHTAVADAINRLISNPGKRSEMGENACHKIEECYSTETEKTAWLTLYRQLIDHSVT